MKTTILTLVFFLSSARVVQAQCIAGNALYTTIHPDGNMRDWDGVLANPQNNTYDGAPDKDAPITDRGRDFVRMAYTMDPGNFYLYLERAGSSNNQVGIALYMDVNNNGGMEANEPVIGITWSGSNRRGSIAIYDYVPVQPQGDALTPDGAAMPGKLAIPERELIATNIIIGSADGLSAEIAIPLQKIMKNGSLAPTDQLQYRGNFNFHVSSINGNVSNVGPGTTNDNWRKCNAPFAVLPVRLISFLAFNMVDVTVFKWKLDQNETAASFEMENSSEGRIFTTICRFDPVPGAGSKEYFFTIPAISLYTRLKITDSQGAITYSRIVMLPKPEEQVDEVKILTNPVPDQLGIRYGTMNESMVTVKIYNPSGFLVYQVQAYCHKGINTIMIPRLVTLVKGIYTIETLNGKKERNTIRAIKL